MISALNENQEAKAINEVVAEMINKGEMPSKSHIPNYVSPAPVNEIFGNTSFALNKSWLYHFLYSKITWIMASAQLIANSAVASGYDIVHDEDYFDEDEKPSATLKKFMKGLKKFLKKCNKDQSFSEIYRQLHIDLATNGKCYLIFEYLESKPPFTVPIAIYRADYRNIKPIYRHDVMAYREIDHGNYKNEIVGWVQEVIEDLESFIEKKGEKNPNAAWLLSDGGTNTRYFYPQQVLEIKLDASGVSPLECLANSMATELAAQSYTYSYFKNSTKTGMVFSMQGFNGQPIDENTAKRQKAWLQNEYTSPENAWKPMLLMGNINLVKDSANIANVQFLEIRQFNKEECCAAMGTYVSLFGSEKSSSSGREEDKLAFEQETVRPREVLILDKISSHLKQTLPPELKAFNLVAGAKSKASQHLMKIAQLQGMCGGSVNENRNLIGLPTYEGNEELYNEPLVAANLMPVRLIEEAVKAKQAGQKMLNDNNTGQARNDGVQSGKGGVYNEQRGGAISGK